MEVRSSMGTAVRSDPFRPLLLALLAGLAAACGKESPPPGPGVGVRFVERGEAAGLDFRMEFMPGEQGEKFKINLYDHGCGVAIADIDRDGDDDLYFTNQLGPCGLYRNDGGGRFTNVTAAAGPVALEDRITVSPLFGDVDNDGDPDLYVTSTRGGNAFFRNDGKGKFTDATREAGLEWVGHSQNATFFDADGDGFLDLFLSNTARWTLDAKNPQDRYHPGVEDLRALVESPIEQNVFFRNQGDGTFRNATDEAGLHGVGWGGDTAVFDYDADGDLDLYVANMFGISVLYRNDGKGRFEDVTREVLGRTPWGTIAARAFDYDGDGLLDLFVADMHSDMWMDADYDVKKIEPHRKYRGFYGRYLEEPGFDLSKEANFALKTRIRYDTVFFGNGVYRNAGQGKFMEVSDSVGAETFQPWGIANGDFDNDGYEDVFIPAGMGFPFFYRPFSLLMNDRGTRFVDRAAEAGLEPRPGGPHLPNAIAGKAASRSSRAAATADFNGDGRLDLVVCNFNERSYLYLNESPKRNWIAFRLEGTKGNRDAIGALLRLRAGGRTLVRQVQAQGGYLSQSWNTVHFGLGDAGLVDSCDILWPGGKLQVLPAPPVNRVHAVKEPS
jgi:hypothetical protein